MTLHSSRLIASLHLTMALFVVAVSGCTTPEQPLVATDAVQLEATAAPNQSLVSVATQTNLADAPEPTATETAMPTSSPTPDKPDLGRAVFNPPTNESLVLSEEWGYVPVNQLAMVLGEGLGAAAADRIASDLGGSVVGEIAYINLYQVEIAASTEDELIASVARAREIEGVELAFPLQTIELDETITIQGVRCSPLSDPVYQGENAKPYEMIGLQRAWDLMRGAGVALNPVKVGIIDSGLYRAKGEFDGSGSFTTMGDAELPTAQTRKNGVAYDEGSHGTGVASVIGANPDNGGVTGVASNLGDKLVVTNSNLFGSDYTDAYTVTNSADLSQEATQAPMTWSLGGIRALKDQIEAKATIINCSWGSSNADPDSVRAYRRFLSQMARDHPDVLFVCSAGNDGQAQDGSRRYPSGVNLPNVITVGNVENDGTIRATSNRAGPDFEVTLAAPGHAVPSGVSDDGVVVNSGGGTSYATPQVAAAAAILRSINPKLSAGEIKGILTSTATGKVNTSGQEVAVDPGLGAGVVRVDAAVLKVINAMREAEKLDPFDPAVLVNLAVIDGVAIAEESATEGFNDYTVKAIVGAVGQDGTSVSINLQGQGAIDGSTQRHQDSAGELSWGISLPLDEENITVRLRRLEAGSCCDILIPNLLLEFTGMYTGSMTTENVTFNSEAIPFVDIDEDEENDIDVAQCEEQARQQAGKTVGMGFDFVPETEASGDAILYMQNEDTGEWARAEDVDFYYTLEGAHLVIELTAWNDPDLPIDAEGLDWRFEGDLSALAQRTEIRGTMLYTLRLEDGVEVIRMDGPWSVAQPRAE